MPLYRLTNDGIEKIDQISFSSINFHERRDIQRILRDNISILGDDLIVISEEFGDWEDSNRRIDLLCLDKQSSLIVIEIKRGIDGGHMELQAIRYAAMISGMTFDQLASAYSRYHNCDRSHAGATLLSFLGWDDETDGTLSGDLRIILISENFSREITTSVLWLNKCGLDITCYRMQPHNTSGVILIDIQQIIPLPEAAEYETKLKAQRQETERVESARKEIFFRFWGQLIERSREKTQVVAGRRPGRDHWLTGRIGRAGFEMNFTLNQNNSQVECYIKFGREGADKATAIYNKLLLQSEEIESSFGGRLVWEDLPNRLGCRISYPVDGGWRTPESEWPEFQSRLIEAMAKLESSLRGPISRL